jgi:hypothetical protein
MTKVDGYAVYAVTRDSKDRATAWEARSPVVATLDEALALAEQSTDPTLEIAEMVRGFGVLTPHFAD